MSELATERFNILCVDDEPNVLEGLVLNLRRDFGVITATSGREGLELLAKEGPFAVVLSDMRMPEMDGAAFLAQVRKEAPNTTRMLLTGYTDLNAAVAAVNEGQIFRFLTKPCPPQQLRAAFSMAVQQYRLVTSEKVLLEQTLRGSIQTLTDVLSLTNPVAFGRATRVKQLVTQLADAMDIEERWQIEVAAMLSQLGAISLPEDTAGKYFNGQSLNSSEQEMIDCLPEITRRLLENIPRLEPILDIMDDQNVKFENTDVSKSSSLGARILKITCDLDELESGGLSTQAALDTMRGRQGWYDPEIFQLLLKLKASAGGAEIKEISLRELRLGMVLVDDVKTRNGLLLVARGYEVTQSFLERIRNFRDGVVNEPLRITVK